MKADDLLLHKALRFAAVRHAAQKRKGTDIPYISHPAEVALILASCGCRKECVIAGVLHDTVEDTETTPEEIVAEFGEEIAGLVAAESEDKSKSWRERKQATIDALSHESADAVNICLADKLSNLRSMLYDYKTVGDALWSRFNADKDSIAWYYRGVINAAKNGNAALKGMLIDVYAQLFGNTDGIEQ